MLYRIQFDCVDYYVEAPDIKKAIDAWKAHVKLIWGDDYEESDFPESIHHIHEGSVIREFKE